MEFASILIYSHLNNLGFSGLPDKEYWHGEYQNILAKKLIQYLESNLSNESVWIKFDLLLAAIFQDELFTSIFTKELSSYIGNKKFAETIIERAKSGELMWSHECVALFKRMEKVHAEFISRESTE